MSIKPPKPRNTGLNNSYLSRSEGFQAVSAASAPPEHMQPYGRRMIALSDSKSQTSVQVARICDKTRPQATMISVLDIS